MYSNDGVASPLDEWEVRRYRWAPRIRNYDDDNVEPEGDADKKDEKNADADETNKTASDANANNADNANATATD